MFEDLDEIELLKAINETGKAISALAEQQETLLKEHGLPEHKQTLAQLLAPGLKLLFYREIELKKLRSELDRRATFG